MQQVPEFCRYCGANIPPREGEGTCHKCDPVGVAEHVKQREKDENSSVD